MQSAIAVAVLLVPGATTGALLAPGPAAAQASAAKLSVNKPCYVDTVDRTGVRAAMMTVAGSGFVPGDPVHITSSDGSVNDQTTANNLGDINVTIGAPTPTFTLPVDKVQTLTASDFAASGTVTASTPVKDTELAVATRPAQARPAQRVTWYFAGFRPGHLVYGHYLRKHQVALARFGRARGVCGLLRVRARFYPGGHQRYQHYRLQFDDSRRYHKHSTPRIDTSLNTNLS
jgi:hypothetical protein